MADAKHPFDILYQSLPPDEDPSFLLSHLPLTSKKSLRQSCKAGLRVVDSAITGCAYDALDDDSDLRLECFQFLQRLRGLSRSEIALPEASDESQLLHILPLIGVAREGHQLVASTAGTVSSIRALRVMGSCHSDASICAIRQTFPSLQQLSVYSHAFDAASVSALPASLTQVSIEVTETLA